MPSYKSVALVLKRTNFGEADRLITLLTPEHGKVKAIAKGVRRIKARMAGHLELFSEVELMLAQGKNLDVITSARLIHYPQTLTDNYPGLSCAYFICEVLERLIHEQQASPEVYELSRDSLRALENNPQPRIIELWFKLRLAAALGYRPNLSTCSICGNGLAANERLLFDPSHGGMVHEGCSGGQGVRMAEREVKLWRAVFDYPWPKLQKLDIPELELGRALAASEHFYSYVFGAQFKRTKNVMAAGT